jgi:FAD/FMN-containing dehydrogenase
MKPSRRTFLRRFFWAAFVAVAVAACAIAEKIYEYAAPPTKAKNCDFVYPVDEPQAERATIRRSTGQSLKLTQSGGFINDASCLNKTPIYGIVAIGSEGDLKSALQFARENHLRVTVAGQRHSMGGQSFSRNGLVLDMRSFNRIRLSKADMILNAQSGATWAQIQPFLDREGLSVKAMQSINVPTVGGTLSVNAHGIAHDPGQIAPTVRSLRIMLSNGEVETASPTQNPELFQLALGGYGLFGVILDADLEVTQNEVYEWKTEYMNYTEFRDYYRKKVEGNSKIGLAYGRLSVSPSSYLTETAFHTYEKRDSSGVVPPLEPLGQSWLVRLVLNFSKSGGLGRRVRWGLEKHVEPRIYPCLSRNQAMARGEGCFVTRNHEMADSMDYLKDRLDDTNILQEYFIPQDRTTEFVEGLRQIVEENRSNLLNVTIRAQRHDYGPALRQAGHVCICFVFQSEAE